MPPPSTGPQKPVTAQQVEEWLQAINRKRLELSLHAMEPLYNTRRELAVMEMSQLLQDAIEEVRVMSASLREQSQAIRDHSSAGLYQNASKCKRGRKQTGKRTQQPRHQRCSKILHRRKAF